MQYYNQYYITINTSVMHHNTSRLYPCRSNVQLENVFGELSAPTGKEAMDTTIAS